MGYNELVPRTASFKEAQQQGRLVMAMIAAGGKCPIVVISFYAWVDTKGEAKGHLRSKLMATISHEMAQWPRLPTFIVGDLNDDALNVPSPAWQLQAGQWHDLGALANVCFWGVPLIRPLP